MDQVKFDGQKVTLGEKEYVLAPLTLRQIRNLKESLAVVGDKSISDEQKMDAFVHIVGESMRRNYPETTDDELLDLLDMGNVAIVVTAVMQVSGFNRAAPGGDAKLVGP